MLTAYVSPSSTHSGSRLNDPSAARSMDVPALPGNCRPSRKVPDSRPISVPPIECVVGSGVVQLTATFVPLTSSTWPAPFETTQGCPEGCVATVTAYAAPDSSRVANTNRPLAVTVRFSPPFRRTSCPTRPLTVPPIENCGDGGMLAQATPTLLTFELPVMRPVPLVTVQVCPEDCVTTVTAYSVPFSSRVTNVNRPFAVMDSRSAPSPSTTVPFRPVTEPPTVKVPLRTMQLCPAGCVATVTE